MHTLWTPEPDWGDDESWRGELHRDPEVWRGEAHFADWPEEAAGPEYWLFKQWGDRPIS